MSEEKKQKRARTSDIKFFEVCEAVAADPTVTGNHTEEVAKRLGLTPGTVAARRSAFNKQYKDSGLRLTDYPRGGGQKKDVNAIAEKLLAMRAAASEQEQEQEQEQESAE